MRREPLLKGRSRRELDDLFLASHAVSESQDGRGWRVSWHRGGTAGSDSVNVTRQHSWLAHFHRRLHHATDTSSRPRRTSRGRVSTYSCTWPETSSHALSTNRNTIPVNFEEPPKNDIGEDEA
jgi:hypothetical protein